VRTGSVDDRCSKEEEKEEEEEQYGIEVFII